MNHGLNPTVVVKSNVIILQDIIHQWAKATPVEPVLGHSEDTGLKRVALASFMLKFILVVLTSSGIVVKTTKRIFNTDITWIVYTYHKAPLKQAWNQLEDCLYWWQAR